MATRITEGGGRGGAAGSMGNKAKKSAAKVAQRSSVKVSSNVKVIPGKMSPTSLRYVFVNEKLTSGADKARSQNAAKLTGLSKAEAKANARGLKAANKPLSKGNAKAPFKGGDSANVLKNSPPARANRTRGGSMATLKRQAAEKAKKIK